MDTDNGIALAWVKGTRMNADGHGWTRMGGIAIAQVKGTRMNADGRGWEGLRSRSVKGTRMDADERGWTRMGGIAIALPMIERSVLRPS